MTFDLPEARVCFRKNQQVFDGPDPGAAITQILRVRAAGHLQLRPICRLLQFLRRGRNNDVRVGGQIRGQRRRGSLEAGEMHTRLIHAEAQGLRFLRRAPFRFFLLKRAHRPVLRIGGVALGLTQVTLLENWAHRWMHPKRLGNLLFADFRVGLKQCPGLQVWLVGG